MNKSTSFWSIHKDFLGFAASMLCAIHCAALPLILTFSTLSGLAFLENHLIELVFLIISVVVAIWSLLPSYKKHQNKRPLIIAGFGLSILIISRFLPHGFAEHIMTAIGGFLVAVSHFVNWKHVKKTCNCKSC